MPRNMRPLVSSRDEQINSEPSPGEVERAARLRRRRRFRSRLGAQAEQKDEKESRTVDSPMTETPPEEKNATDPNPANTEVNQERKPWESLVVGDLGENLSYIEEKDREIEQQRYILKYHEENSPHEAAHHKKILEELIEERAQMSDSEENNMPEEQREEKDRLAERMSALNWALETCQCKAEEVNIRAAIQGYQTGDIPYSRNFTLIYAGHIVDVCSTYRSFCEDRQERLDRYYATFGPGWLWHEPPLSGPRFEVLAKKSLCLDRVRGPYQIGCYPVDLRFTVDKRKVMRGFAKPWEENAADSKSDTEASCHLKTLLDSGATFPILAKQDLKRLRVDMKWYAAQGVMTIATMGGLVKMRFFEMQVSVCSGTGESLVGEGDQAVWPAEPRVLGGFYPVQVDESKGHQKSITFMDRLSGMVPFEACYMSSAPTLNAIWVGEDRRDVLGANRMPAHLRFDSEKTLELAYPEDFQLLREEARTPDQVIFVHDLGGNRKVAFIDADLPDKRGRSEMAIVENKYRMSKSGKRPRVKTVAKDKAVIEPRNSIYNKRSKPPLSWRANFLSPARIILENEPEEIDK
ncbi:hypothetical protein F4779DRAFT_626280 [Xylariaceae sp. FL0662B]|nr:hypothetical protein F4779DRAFT_626280 [Xylariaceae sp. FL0662B]